MVQPSRRCAVHDRDGTEIRRSSKVKISHPSHACYGKPGTIMAIERQKHTMRVQIRVWSPELERHILVWANHRSVVVMD